MPIPDFQSIMLPLLKLLKNKEYYALSDVANKLAQDFNLNDSDLSELLPSGKQPKFRNRVGWARTYLKKAGLLEQPARGIMKITDKGLDVLEENPKKININFLQEFPEFIEFRTINKDSAKLEEEEIDREETPDELIDKGYNLIKADLGQEILHKLKDNTPAFFEKVVLDLLSSMGYGEGEVTGRSGDGGIDGIISQDKLGLDKIVFQAKRYKEGNHVSSEMIRGFIGALETKRINKGVFITTSKFSNDAEQTIFQSQKSIVLISGNKLVQLMMDYNLGVTSKKEYKIKEIDSDYFSEE
ncbi:MAG: Restriction endonuclease [Parcubacteria bacterium 32_520]|nr:MAG: Restriction endonuclease [Parcubacteria bacterium 32_520]